MDKDDAINDFLKDWESLGERHSLNLDITREITPRDISHLLLNYSYVQLLNPYSMGEFGEIRFVRAPSGWLITDYKNAISVSPGEKLFTDAGFVIQNGQQERVYTGVGTRIKQVVDTGREAARVAAEENHWPEIHVVNGTSMMCWGVWLGAIDLGIKVTGYVPSAKQQRQYEEIMSHCPSLIATKTVAPRQPAPGADLGGSGHKDDDH